MTSATIVPIASSHPEEDYSEDSRPVGTEDIGAVQESANVNVKG